MACGDLPDKFPNSYYSTLPVTVQPPRDRPGPSSGSLLFINKGPQSGKTPNDKRKVASIINRHVQRFSAHRARGQRDETLRLKSAAVRRLSDSQRGSKEHDLDLRRSDNLSKDEVQELEGTLQTEASPKAPESLHLQQGHRESQQILNANFSAGDCMDPFNCTSIPMNNGILSMLQYYLAFSILTKQTAGMQPISHPKRSLLLVYRHEPAVEEVFQAALSNEMHMYALLSATACRMKLVSGISLNSQDTAAKFIQKSLRCIRLYLQSCTGPIVETQVILDVFFLCVCEWFLQNYPVALMHLNAMRQMMTRLDLSSRLDLYVYQTARYNDIVIATETAIAPVFPETWDVRPLSTGRLSHIKQYLETYPDHHHVGWGFRKILAQHVFSPVMNAILEDLIPWSSVVQYAWLCKVPAQADEEWLLKQGSASLHQLLSMAAISPEPVPFTKSKRREECFRYVLIMLLASVTTSMAWRSSKMNMMRLKTVLGIGDLDWESVYMNRVLLWVLLHGSVAAEGTVDEEWFVQRTVQVAKKLAIRDPHELNHLTAQYFSANELQHNALRTLVKKITQRLRT